MIYLISLSVIVYIWITLYKNCSNYTRLFGRIAISD